MHRCVQKPEQDVGFLKLKLQQSAPDVGDEQLLWKNGTCL